MPITYKSAYIALITILPAMLFCKNIAGQNIAEKNRVPITVQQQPQVKFTLSPNGLSSLSYRGQSYYHDSGSSVQGAIFQSPDGNSVDAGWSNPSKAIQSTNPYGYQQIYNLGGAHQFTLKVVLTTPDTNTIKAVAYVTNNDTVNTLAFISLHLLSLALPGPANVTVPVGQPLSVNQYNGDVVTLLGGTWGSVASWISGYPTAASQLSYYNSASQTTFANMLNNQSSNGPNSYSLPIPPGQTQTFTQLVRFGKAGESAASLAPEAFREYRTAFPYLLNWPDRRPIAYWLIADATNGRSPSNPRGYLWDKTIDSTNLTTFRTRVLAQADNTIGILNGMYPKPQALLIWDLEGQEFDQPFTYVGYPNYLASIAPEMDAVADQLIGKITAAGYKIGLTIRPNTFGAGTQLPANCYSSLTPNVTTQYDLADKFIKLNAPYPFRGYVCAGNAWVAGSANHPTAQTSVQDYGQVLSLLEQKITYAKNRWGASIFYVDSDVWEGGAVLEPSIFRELAKVFPDCLIIPETAGTFHFGATAPYEAAKTFNYYGTSQARKDVYPSAFGVVNVADADTVTNWTKLVKAVESGDILLFRGWFAAPEISAVQQIYSAAASLKQ